METGKYILLSGRKDSPRVRARSGSPMLQKKEDERVCISGKYQMKRGSPNLTQMKRSSIRTNKIEHRNGTSRVSMITNWYQLCVAIANVMPDFILFFHTHKS
ncbi:unnamed protein product, partial [Brassica oleracea var. botrytis]